MTDVCLPDCMMPDGGQCCAGYAKQRQRIEALEADVIRFVGQRDKALEFISTNARRIEALEAALNYVADMTYYGGGAEWHFKLGYDPQEVLDVLVPEPDK